VTAKSPKGDVWRSIRSGLSFGLLLLVLALAAVLIVIPRIVGAIPLTVLTSSMEPTLPPGTLIVVRPVDTDAIAIGDVITYQIKSGEADVITHRVVGIDLGADGTRTFTLKGDNNAVPDVDPVREVQIQGKLWYSVPLIGHLSLFMNGDARGIIVPIGAGLLFAFAAWMFISGIVGSARKRAAEKKLQALAGNDESGPETPRE
jgi:signal peptidase